MTIILLVGLILTLLGSFTLAKLIYDWQIEMERYIDVLDGLIFDQTKINSIIEKKIKKLEGKNVK